MLDAVLSAAGYRWYEISNWCQSGEESGHNLNYWMQGDYRGIGCAAHSHRAGRRWWNVRAPERYIEMIGSGLSAQSMSETLTSSQRRLESLELSLRTRYGVPAAALAGAIETEPALAELVSVDETTDRAVLTLAGRLLANEVACRLRPNATNMPSAPGVRGTPRHPGTPTVPVTPKVPDTPKVPEMGLKAIGRDPGTVVSMPWPSRSPG